MELQKNQSKLLRKLYFRHFHSVSFVLMVFQGTRASSCGCYILE